MVSITSGTIKKRAVGDQIKVTMDLTGIANSNTLAVAHLRNIEDGRCDCTTDDTISITFSGNTVTFLDGATLAGRLVVFGR